MGIADFIAIHHICSCEVRYLLLCPQFSNCFSKTSVVEMEGNPFLKENRITFLYLFLAVLGLCCCTEFSLVAASRGHSPAVMCRLVIAVASPVAEHGL